MKFLIAASFLCLALVGQIQGGSLRGYTVRVPHQVYGAPVVDDVEDNPDTVIEAAKVEEPSVEYGAPAVVPTVESAPYVDSLPLVDSVVNFNTPAEVYGPPAVIPSTTPKPELPYLKPGLPELPAAPVVPVEVIVPEVPSTYLPPVKEVPSTYLPPVKELPSTPAPVAEPSEVYGPPAEVYGPPAPQIVDLPTIPAIPALPELPSTPATPIVEDVREGGYHYAPPTPETPKVTIHSPEPSVVYGPPVVAHEVVHIEPVHVAPVSHLVPVVPEVPVPVPVAVPVEAAKQGYSYNRPTKDFPTPVTVPLHGLVSSSQNLAASTSSFQVNDLIVPGLARPTTTDDAVIVEELKPSGPGFAIHSVTGNSHKTSVGTFNQVSFVNHELPYTSFGGFVGTLPLLKEAVPHGAYAAPSF